MKRVKGLAAAVCVGGAMALAGCGGDGNDGIRGVSRGEAASLNSEHSRFESSEDPAFTAQTHYAAGQLAESQGNARAAIEQYRAGLKVEPGHRASLYRLGVVYAQVRAYPEAIATWEEYVKRTGGDATAYANMGFCHELAGQSDVAEAAYQKGIAKDGKNNASRVNYGLMLARAGRGNEALIQLQAVLTAAQAHYNLGSVYEQMGKKAEAKAEYRKALELDPGLGEAKTRLAGVE